MPNSIEPFFLGYGVLGIVTLLLMTGILRPKWAFDEWAKRDAAKDKIIESLTDSVRRMTDKLEAKL